MFTPQEVAEGRTGLDDTFKEQVRMPPDMRGGVTIKDYLAKMDRAGIDRSLMIAVRAGDMNVKGSFEITYARVAEVCAANPERFSELAGVDPFRGMQGIYDPEQAVKEPALRAIWRCKARLRHLVRSAPIPVRMGLIKAAGWI